MKGWVGRYLQGLWAGPVWGLWEGSSSVGKTAPLRWGRSWWSRPLGCCWWCRELGPSSAQWTQGNAPSGPALHTGRAALCFSSPPCGEHTGLLPLLTSVLHVLMELCYRLFTSKTSVGSKVTDKFNFIGYSYFLHLFALIPKLPAVNERTEFQFNRTSVLVMGHLITVGQAHAATRHCQNKNIK